MRALLDTHALLWAVEEPARLGSNATAVLQDPNNDLALSIGSVWELSIKLSLRKLSLSLPFLVWMEKALNDLGVELLPITVEHADVQSRIPFLHRDPFDRLLVAQVSVEGISLISADVVFDQYGVSRLW